MKTKKLGKTGLEISEVGYGTWGLGGVYYGEVDNQQGIDAVKAYIDAGGNHLDSAYSYHKAELLEGIAIENYDRDKLILASKSYAGCFNRDKPWQERLQEELDITLRDLKTDYVDIYMIHAAPTEQEHLDELLDEYEKLREQGKIRFIGVSVPGPSVTDESVERALLSIRSGRVDMVECNYSIARQKMGRVFDEALEKGVGIIARWVVESGMLSGKYTPGHEFIWPDTRNRYQPSERDGILEIGQFLKNNLPEGYESPVQVAAKFALAEPGVSGIILGGTKAEQVLQNMKISDLPDLSDDFIATLKEKYADRNDEFNPTGEFEHVKSPRKDPSIYGL